MGRGPIADMNHRGLRSNVTMLFGRSMSWSEDGTAFWKSQESFCCHLMCRFGCRGVIHDCVPDEMVSIGGNGSQDQL